MCGTDTAGRGALEPPPEAGARTKLFDREFQFRELHTSDRIPEKKNNVTCIQGLRMGAGSTSTT